MFVLDVMYYYTQRLYNSLLKNISPSNQPAIILSSFIAFPLALLVDSIYIHIYCTPPPPWIFISVCFGFIILMLKIYEWDNRKDKILKKKPLFFESKKLTLFIYILINVLSLSALFMGGPIGKYLLEQCGWRL